VDCRFLTLTDPYMPQSDPGESCGELFNDPNVYCHKTGYGELFNDPNVK
jgi:hypothetical protein